MVAPNTNTVKGGAGDGTAQLIDKSQSRNKGIFFPQKKEE